MADTPTPPDAATSKLLQDVSISLGFKINKKATQQVAAEFEGLSKLMKTFEQTSQFKESVIWNGTKLGDLVSKLSPVTAEYMRMGKTVLHLGHLSKLGAIDTGEFFNSLSLGGKLGVNTLDLVGKAFTRMGFSAASGIMVATLGIAALVAIVATIGKFIVEVSGSVFDARNELVEFDRVAMGLGKEGLYRLQTGLNSVHMEAMRFGMNLTEVNAAILEYTKLGIPIEKITGEFRDLAVVTQQLSTITGESASNIAGLFSSLIIKARLSIDSIKALSNTLATYNKVASGPGMQYAQLSFSNMKAAIDSSTNALIVASNKGAAFAERMGKDLIALAGLAQNVGLSIEDMNSKFEEAGNLISSPDSSGFRAILAISGGANFSQMLSGQFNKTDAMLKVATTLQTLNRQFGGNLNLTAQIAEKQFGIGKTMALQLINMNSDMIEKTRRMQEALNKVQDKATEDAYRNVTGTLGDIWTKFKNTMASIWKVAIAQSPELGKFLNTISEQLQRLMDNFNKPGGLMQRLVTSISDTFNRLGASLNGTVGKWIEKLGDWLVERLPIYIEGFAKGILKLVDMIKQFFDWLSEDGGGLSGYMGMFVKIQLGLLGIATDVGIRLGKGIVSYIMSIGGGEALFFGSDSVNQQQRREEEVPATVATLVKQWEEQNNQLVEQKKTPKEISEILNKNVKDLMSSWYVTNFKLQGEYKSALMEALNNSPTLSKLISSVNNNTSSTKDNTSSTEAATTIQQEIDRYKNRLEELKKIDDLQVIIDTKAGKTQADFMLAGEKRVELQQKIDERENKKVGHLENIDKNIALIVKPAGTNTNTPATVKTSAAQPSTPVGGVVMQSLGLLPGINMSWAEYLRQKP